VAKAEDRKAVGEELAGTTTRLAVLARSDKIVVPVL
jgi:hypothetical protein